MLLGKTVFYRSAKVGEDSDYQVALVIAEGENEDGAYADLFVLAPGEQPKQIRAVEGDEAGNYTTSSPSDSWGAAQESSAQQIEEVAPPPSSEVVPPPPQ